MYEEEFEFRGLTLLDAVSQATDRCARLREQKMDDDQDAICLRFQVCFDRLKSKVIRYADEIASLQREAERVEGERRGNLTDAAIFALSSAAGALGIASRTLRGVRALRNGASLSRVLLTVVPFGGTVVNLLNVRENNRQLNGLQNRIRRAEERGRAISLESQDLLREAQSAGCELSG